ncbi:MAG TPA: FAD-dependent oxidoreductase [Mogibacterium sp.]|nr:FAD-dependent oxidoreductase [Mogibacterium sp.]
MKKIVIIGGVAGGATSAARMRRLDDKAEIILLERGDYISYANCGLPYYVGDVIKQRSALLVTTPEQMRDRFRIDVRTGNEALKIDRENKTVEILDKATGKKYKESYDKLVISTGSSPLRPPIPGIDSDLIQTLWTMPDTDKIRHIAHEGGISTAAVIGGGFIGLEIAENLHFAGLKTTIIEAVDQVMPPTDPEMASLLQENIIENGIELVLSDPVDSFEEITQDGKRMIKIRLKSGNEYTAEFVVLSIGLRPNSGLAKDAGLTLNQRGYIVVDEYLRTEDPDIYAVGDVIEVEDFTLKTRFQYQLAGPANKQGRIVANNILGKKEKYEGTQATSVVKLFDMTVGMTGQSEKALVANGFVKDKDFKTVYITQNHHAGYYPGAKPMVIKTMFTPDGKKILGTQIVGMDGVDKRIDNISNAVRLGAKATDLAKLELAYAPPYSSAKDPVNMVGFVIRNIIDGLVVFADWDELEKAKAEGRDVQLIDIREEAEVFTSPIEGALQITQGELREKMPELDKDKEIILFCSIGVRSYNAARTLMENGFKNVKVYPGGTRLYNSTHYDVEELKERAAARAALSSKAKSSAAVRASFDDSDVSIRVNCSGMQCPGPILKVFESINNMEEGEVLEVIASDPGFAKDIVAWCKRTGNTLLSNEKVGDEYVAHVMKGLASDDEEVMAEEGSSVPVAQEKGKTIIVFSGDMDKVMASFIIANGAAAMGKPVTMFFTFWGLSVLRKADSPNIKKTPMEAMFGMMLPKGADKLSISKMNMGGLGTAMMKKIMKDKNVDSLEDLIKSAMNNGVKIVACTMSMDVMGLKADELIDEVELGGVGYYLGDAEDSNVNLFI